MKHYFPVTIQRGNITRQNWDYGGPTNEVVIEKCRYYVTEPKLPEESKFSSFYIRNNQRLELMADEQGNLYQEEQISQFNDQTQDGAPTSGTYQTIYQVDVWFSGFDYDESPSHSGYEYFWNKEDAERFMQESQYKYNYGKSCQSVDCYFKDRKYFALSPMQIPLSAHDRQYIINHQRQPLSTVPTSYVKGSYEADLAYALHESKKTTGLKSGKFTLFAPTATSPSKAVSSSPIMTKKTEAIPNRFFCPISLEIMKEPVLFIVDGHTYEKTKIIQWLTGHRCSPLTNEEMTADQNIKNVLQINRALVEEIEEFTTTHLELFETGAPTL